MKEIQSMCNYCGTGCSLVFHVDENEKIVKVTGAKDYPVNRGVLCPKGFKANEYIYSKDRATSPLIKDKDGTFKEASWDDAIKVFTDKVKDLNKNNKNKDVKPVAFISTGQLSTEEFTLLGMLRGVMGMEGDGNTRLCMASAVMGYKQPFGFDAPPLSYSDMEESDCIIFVGSNAAITHPMVFNKLKNNKNNPEIIVIDPRFSDTAKKATLHLQITPKKDLLLLYTLANYLIKRDKCIDHKYIKDHTNSFEEFKAFVSQFGTENIEENTGIKLEDFEKLAHSIETRKKVSFWWTMGVNQSHEGTRTAHAMINICLMTGNIGRKGTGPLSLTGQTNAMGSRLFSNTTSLFGGRDFTNEKHRKEIMEILEVEDDMLPSKPTISYDKIVDGIDKGEIKALWVVCTNPLHSYANSEKIKKAFEKLELLVVQDLFSDTATSKMADVFFPAGTMGEKEGVYVNSERRIGYAGKAKELPGNALSDYDIFLKIWKSYGKSETIDKWSTPAKCFELLKKFSKGMPCDFSKIRNYEHLLEKQGIQWPYASEEDDKSNERRLFENGEYFTADKRANFLFEEIKPSFQALSEEYPICLLTGRGSIFQFHTMTRSSRCPSLNKAYDPKSFYFELSPEDSKKYEIEDKQKVKIVSKSGTFTAEAKITKSVKEGTIFIPFHFEGSNNLVLEELDSISRQPSFKFGAVRLEKV